MIGENQTGPPIPSRYAPHKTELLCKQSLNHLLVDQCISRHIQRLPGSHRRNDVTWKRSRNQFLQQAKFNTKSSKESELVGADQALSSILHTGYFIEAQGYSVKQNLLFQDNQSTMHLKNSGSLSSSKRTKHVKCCYFFSNKIADGNLKVLYCPTEIMWADVLTKPKQGGPFRHDRSHLI